MKIKWNEQWLQIDRLFERKGETKKETQRHRETLASMIYTCTQHSIRLTGRDYGFVSMPSDVTLLSSERGSV